MTTKNLLSSLATMLMVLCLFISPATAETFGNNLSFPAIFAEGIGITGLPTGEDTGLRGGTEPYLVEPYEYEGLIYYLQQTVNTWQADWADGTSGGESVRVDWSDNLVRQTWNERSIIRVEVVLFKDAISSMQLNGYNMFYLYGEGTGEVWGTDGTTYLADLATAYSICARLKIEKLDDAGNAMGTPLYDSAIYERFGVDGPTDAYSAEINVSGKLIYGYNWNLDKFDLTSIGLPPNTPKDGWYRLTFSLDPSAIYSITDESGNTRDFDEPCNLILGSLDPADLPGNTTPDPVVYPPELDLSGTSTSLEIYIAPKIKGGGGGGGKPSS